MAAILALDSREADLALALPGTLAGIAALTMVMGLIVLAIGAELVVHGIVEHGAVTNRP